MDGEQKPSSTRHEQANADIVDGKRNKKDVILRPQPTNDPNEPLVSYIHSFRKCSRAACQHMWQNWSQGEKNTTYLVICWFTFLGFMNSSAFTATVVPNIKDFKKTATEASYLSMLQYTKDRYSS